MTNTIALSNPSTLPTAAQSFSSKFRPAAGNSCACSGDGKLAFALPWITITTLGTFATLSQPDHAFVVQALLPGLLAGFTGLILYKSTKKVIKAVRRLRSQMA